MRVEDVIASECLETYQKELKVIAEQLVFANNNLYIIKQIVEFPFSLFTDENDRTFWVLTSKAYFDSTVMALWTILGDQKSNFLINKFCKKIQTSVVHEGYQRADIEVEVQRELLQELDKVNFEKRIKQLRIKLDNVRNHFIAHLDYDTQLGLKTLIQYEMDYAELRQIVDIANELMLILGFEVEHLLWFWNYLPQHGTATYVTDIERLLAFVASQSNYIRRFGTTQEKERTHAQVEKLPNDQKRIVENWQQRVDKLFGKDEP